METGKERRRKNEGQNMTDEIAKDYGADEGNTKEVISTGRLAEIECSFTVDDS
jgi:hypothetical protein